MFFVLLISGVLASEQCNYNTYCPGSYTCCENLPNTCCIQYVPCNSFAGCPDDLPYCNEPTNECLPTDLSRTKPAIKLGGKKNNVLQFFVGFSAGYGLITDALNQVGCIEYSYPGIVDLRKALYIAISPNIDDILLGVEEISQAFYKLADAFKRCGRENDNTTFQSLGDIFSETKVMAVRFAYNMIYYREAINEVLGDNNHQTPYEQGYSLGKALGILMQKLPAGTS